MTQSFNSLLDMTRVFADEQACIDHFRALRWPQGPTCPYCNAARVYTFSDRQTFKCGDCRQRFSVRVGTIFEDSKLPLRKWFMAIYLITSHKKGIASTQLAKDIGVTQKTAWFVLHRLRHAAHTRSFSKPLDGDIEIDDTYIGGKEKNKHAHKRTKGNQGRSTKTKSVAMGIIKRGGEVRAFSMERLTVNKIEATVRVNVIPGTNIMTDEYRGYEGLGRHYNHHTVNHGQGEYVRHYFAHTNNIEGFWSILKRGIVGIYHHISAKHLHRYLEEFSYRFNTRWMGEGERVNALLANASGLRLTYKALIA